MKILIKKTLLTSLFELLFQAKAVLLLITVNAAIFIFLKSGPSYSALADKLSLSMAGLNSGEWWRIITAGFVHYDRSHLLFNLLGIFVFGRIVEKHFGFLKTLLIYFISLILSSFFSILIYTFFLKQNITIMGASGAIMGLLSCAMLTDPFRITFDMIVPLPVMIKAWFFFYLDLKGFLTGEKDGISHIAHLLGFFSIAVIMYLLNVKERAMLRNGLIINILSFIILAAITYKLDLIRIM